MTGAQGRPEAAGEAPPLRRLCVYSAGFLTQPRVRHILRLAGWRVSLGLPREGDWVGVWGRSPRAARGEAIAARYGAPLLRVEDAFLRSVLPGRAGGGPPLGLLLDETGVHFDPSQPSDIETLLATHPFDDSGLMRRAHAAIGWMRDAHLSKYTGFDPETPPPEAPYVLVIDQTRGDAAITHGGVDANRFAEMLYWAQEEFHGARIVIKTHPETQSGHRAGHFGPEHAGGRISLCTDAVSPWRLMEGALAVYTVSSGMGFEAIFAGHRPRVFGQPFYAGWGLTDDRFPPPRRGRNLSRAQLFAGAMILAPHWYDAHRGRLCALEDAMAALEAETREWRQDRRGHVAVGMRLWKRRPLQRFFGRYRRLRFVEEPARAAALARAEGRGLLVWAGRESEQLRAAAEDGARSSALPDDLAGDGAAPLRLWRVEDGFLRSRGLGADLVPPMSLVTDDLGIYYDPSRESRLERLIAEAAELPTERLERAEQLVARIAAARLTKYNLGHPPLPDLPPERRILVPGQVEDDASIMKGCDAVRSNRALLEAARAANPGAVILYKPHPDVEAGLRDGALDPEAEALADMVLPGADPAALIEAVDEIWTMTSLMGFEALLRGRAVTCLGTPFYAGWGLTRDLGRVPARRRARPSLAALAHATLIAYPRYFDPVTRSACPAEVVADRLAAGIRPRRGAANRALAKLQGALASHAWIWR